MSIQIKEKGIFTTFTIETNIPLIENEIQAAFSYKKHRYLHIYSHDSQIYNNSTLSFFRRIKELPIILILESPILNDINTVNKIYAAGVDIVIFWIEEATDESILRETKRIFSDSSVIIKKRDGNKSDNDFVNAIPFIAEDSFLEKIIRKIWIDISNLKRKLKVKEVEDSYNASGL